MKNRSCWLPWNGVRAQFIHEEVSRSHGLWLVAFSWRGGIPLKHSIENSLQRTKRSCEKGLGTDNGGCRCSFSRVEHIPVVTQHVAEGAGFTILDGGDEWQLPKGQWRKALEKVLTPVHCRGLASHPGTQRLSPCKASAGSTAYQHAE